MSYFDLNYDFGKSSGNNTSTFIPKSSVVVVPSGDYGYGCLDYKTGRCLVRTRKMWQYIFSLVMPHTYKKILVSLLTPKSHWMTSNPLLGSFVENCSGRYE
ncbi:hypothetical protein Hanom_Chr07g00648431 [Helianthus anomalus]